MLRGALRAAPPPLEISRVSPLPSESAAALRAWRALWRAADLRPVPGWPLWETEVHALLHACWARALSPIFQHYCRSLPTSCVPPARGMSLGQDEWLLLMTDCRVPTRGLEMRRLQRLHAACVPPGAPEPRLLPQHFARALVELSLLRANAEWLAGKAATMPGATPPRPLPGCLVRNRVRVRVKVRVRVS